MENNENKDWYPMVWKKAWYISEYPTVIEALVTRYVSADDTYALSSNKAFGKVYRSKSELFPTAEAALASIRVYDLEGKEVLIPRASVENSEAPTKLSKEWKMQILNLAIAYGDADYQQKDGADRAWYHVAEAREKLIAFVENREPEHDDEY